MRKRTLERKEKNTGKNAKAKAGDIGKGRKWKRSGYSPHFSDQCHVPENQYPSICNSFSSLQAYIVIGWLRIDLHVCL